MRLKSTKASGFRSLVSVLTAVMICAMLLMGALGVSATEMEGALENDADKGSASLTPGGDTAKITEPGEGTPDAAAPEQDLPSAEPDPTEETQPPVVEDIPTAEEMQQAWNDFKKKVSPDLLEQYHVLFITVDKSIQNEKPDYFRRDLCNAMQLCTQAIVMEEDLRTMAQNLTDALSIREDLPQGEKDLYVNGIAARLEQLYFEPEMKVIRHLEEISLAEEDLPVIIDNTEAEAFLNTVMDLTSAVQEFTPVLDLWLETDKKLAMIQDDVLPEGTAPVSDAQMWYADLLEQNKALKAQIDSYFNQSAEQRTMLATSLNELFEAAEVYTLRVALDNSAAIAKQEGRFPNVSEEIETLREKLVFAYIALGVAVLAILMGIVATVFAARKPKEEKIDLSEFVSREDAKVLSSQNAVLKRQLDMLEKRAENARPQQDPGMIEWQKRMEQRMTELEQKDGTTIIITDPVPPEPTPVCNLVLRYSNISPADSYLERREHGPYRLYADRTVKIEKAELGKMNELRSWRDSGLLFLFNPVINGKVYNMDLDDLPGGYYVIAAVKAPAKVEETIAGIYKVIARGQIELEKC